MKKTIFIFIFLFFAVSVFAQDVSKFDIFEKPFFTTNIYANPFTEVEFKVRVTDPDGEAKTVRGFYDGDGNGGQNGGVWKIRFMPDKIGKYTYMTICAQDTQLNGVSGEFNSIASKTSDIFRQHGPIRIHLVNPHAVAHFDGTPFFWNGDTEWIFFDHSFITQQQRLDAIDFLASKKVNNLLITMVNSDDSVIYPWVGTTAGNEDRTRFDLARLRQWEEAIAYMRDNGIAADLWFYSDDSGNIYPAAGGAEEDLYFRYMISRFAAFANVTWNLALEYGEYRTASWVTSRAAFFKAEDPYDSFLAVHDTPDDTWDFPGDPNLDHTSLQRFTTADVLNRVIIDNRKSTFDSGRPIPIFHEEFSIEGASNGDFNVLRKDAWAITCAGGFYKAASLGFWIGAKYNVAKHFDQIKILYETVTKARWYEMEPHNELVSSGGTGRYCLAKVAGPNSEFLIYSISGNSFTLDLSEISGNFSLLWVNPLTGANSEGSITGDAIQTLTNPFGSGEAVLLIKGAAPDATAPSAPETLEARALSATAVELNWAQASDEESGVKGYKIYRGLSEEEITLLTDAEEQNTYTDNTASPETTYFYQVSAVNGSGLEGAPSPLASVTTPSGQRPPEAQNEALKVTEDTAKAFTLKAIDPDGDSVNRFQILSAPSKGAIQDFDSLTGSGEYQPGSDQTGADNFSFQASDDEGLTYGPPGVISITITEVNDAPAAENQSGETLMNKPITAQLVFSDVDGPGPFVYEIAQEPANGALSGSSNDRLYTPRQSFRGTDTFTWRVFDGQDWSNAATWTITVNPDPSVKFGDVDGNNQITAYDAGLAVRIAIGLAENKAAADASGEGVITAYDAALIVQRSVGLIENFPVEK